MRNVTLTLLITIALASIAQAAPFVTSFQQGDGNAYTGTADTYLRDDTVGGNTSDNNYGTAGVIYMNTPDASPAGDTGHGLLRFDNIFGSGPGQIRAWATTITSATITVRIENPGDPVDAFRMLQAWDENTSTWDSMVNGIQTNDSEAASASTDQVTTNSTNGFRTFDVTTDLQAYLDGTTNNGWALIMISDSPANFYSSEDATPGNRPLLSVTYVPEPASALLLGAGVALLAMRHARQKDHA